MSQKNKSQEDFPPWVPPQRGPGGAPWLNDLSLARSTDGLNFEKLDRVVIERGGVPDLIGDYGKGRIVAIFQYFSFEKEEEFNKMAVSFSYDEGENWTKPQVIKLECPEEICRRACDPALALLSDGKYRMYFTGHLPGGRPATYSAISDDCISFKLEEGVRFMDEGKMVLDPAILRIKNTWHYYSHALQPGLITVYHAISDDGLNFTRVDDMVGLGQMLGNGVAVDSGYRFYYNAPRGTRGTASAFSTDGYNWTVDPGIRMSYGGDPGIVRLKDGTYLMLYTAITPR